MTGGLSEDFAGWPPEQTVFPISGVEMRVVAGDHPFYLAEREAIAENWKSEFAANPALFDGRMIFQKRISLDPSGKLSSEGHVTPYSAFLWWRKQPQREGGLHIFAYPVLESSDGALIAVRMGEHTSNPGQVYFAAGSFDQDDVFEGYCDPCHNMRREVLEETGIDLGEASVDDGYHVSRVRRAVTLFRLFRFDRTAQQMADGIERHMRRTEDKEIAGAVVIRSADRSAHPYNIAMPPILDWYFGKDGSS